jgi:putative FmdB family regulatory protein
MPIFEYKCEKCGHVFEQFVFGPDAALEGKACPQCGAPGAKRIVSSFASPFGGQGPQEKCGGGCGSGNRGFS